jgi:hypothetical protein
MAFFKFHIYITIGDGTGTVTGIIADVLSGPDLHVIRNSCVPQPVHRRVHHRFSLFFEALFGKTCYRSIVTTLHDIPDMGCITDRCAPQISWPR